MQKHDDVPADLFSPEEYALLDSLIAENPDLPDEEIDKLFFARLAEADKDRDGDDRPGRVGSATEYYVWCAQHGHIDITWSLSRAQTLKEDHLKLPGPHAVRILDLPVD